MAEGQQLGEIVIRHRDTGEMWAVPRDEPYDRDKWDVVAASGTAQQPFVYGPGREYRPPGRLDRREGFGGEGPAPVDPLALARPEFAGTFEMGSEVGALGSLARESALPTLGSVAGRALPIPGRPFTGEALGGMVGEGANQALGITPPSLTQIGIQGAAPFGARLLGGATPAVARRLPGAQVGLHEAGARELDALGRRLTPAVPSAVLAEAVQQFNPRIPTANLLKAADDIVAKELALPEGSRNRRAIEIAEGLAAELRKPGGSRIPFQDFRAWLQRYGDMTGQAKRQGETLTSESANKVYRAAQKDLDDALERMHVRVGPGGTVVVGEAESSASARALRAFNAAYRKERAAEELGERMLDKGVIRTRDDGLREVHPQRLLEVLRKDGFLAESFTAQEVAEIKAVAEKLRGIPILPPQAGQQFGSGRTLTRGAIAGSLGFATGIDPGYAAAVTAAAPFVISRALSSEPGRRLLLQIIARQPTLDHHALATLAAFTASQAAGPGPGPQLIGPAALR